MPRVDAYARRGASDRVTAGLTLRAKTLCIAWSQPLASRGLSREQKGVRIPSRAAQLERSEILEPISVRHVGIAGLPLRQLEQIFLRDLALLCAIA